jgi:hypothetical protein
MTSTISTGVVTTVVAMSILISSLIDSAGNGELDISELLPGSN